MPGLSGKTPVARHHRDLVRMFSVAHTLYDPVIGGRREFEQDQGLLAAVWFFWRARAIEH